MPIRPTTANRGETSGGKPTIAQIKSNMLNSSGGGVSYPEDGHGEEKLDKMADVFMNSAIAGVPIKVLSNGGGHLYVSPSGRSRIPGATWWGGGHDTLAGGFTTIQGGGTGTTGTITVWELTWSLQGLIELLAGLQCELGKCDDSNSQGPIKVERLIKKCIRGFLGSEGGGGEGGGTGHETDTEMKTTLHKYMSDDETSDQGFDRKGMRYAIHREIICCGECRTGPPKIWSGDKVIECTGIETVITPGAPTDVRGEIGKLMWNCVKKGCPKLFEDEHYTTWEGIDCGFWD